VLITEAKLGDELAIPLNFCPLHIIEEAATPTDHLQQAAAAVMIFLVRLEMFVQVVDAVRKDGHLDAGGTGVGLTHAILLDCRSLVESHVTGCACRAICASGHLILGKPLKLSHPEPVRYPGNEWGTLVAGQSHQPQAAPARRTTLARVAGHSTDNYPFDVVERDHHE